MPAFRVFDAHSHVGEWGSWEMRGNEVSPFTGDDSITTRDGVEARMRRFSLTKQLVVPHYYPKPDKAFETNRFIRYLAKMDDVYGGLWFAPSFPGETASALGDFEEDTIVAMKTSADVWVDADYRPGTWMGDEEQVMEEVMEFCRDNDILVQLHTGSGKSRPEHAFALADRYPDVGFHFVHMGGSAGGHFAFVPRFLDRLGERDNLYFDVSWARGFGVRWIARELEERDALERMLYASDEPWGDANATMHQVLGLDLPGETKEDIFYRNAMEAYGIGD